MSLLFVRLSFERHTENFDGLADLIAAYPSITRNTHFVLVPGPLDITANGILPRQHLLSFLVNRLRTKVPKIHFASNPCRIKFFDQEIVVFREETMTRMLRNAVGVKPDVNSEDLKRYVSSYRHSWPPSNRLTMILTVSPIYTGSGTSEPFDHQHTTDTC
jgi:hypothetical protein